MFRFAVVVVFGFSLSAGIPALAQTEPASPNAASVVESAPVKSDKKICKRQNRTGTRLGADRICKTADEWDRFERQQREDIQKMTEMKGDTDMGQ